MNNSLSDALWRIYNRPERPLPWTTGGNLPWDDPGFSQRMLREHLDQSHGAASRQTPERETQLDWLWKKLNLAPEKRLLDVTCGPGLYATAFAQRGIRVTGVDFGPASIAYAKELAIEKGVVAHCQFIQQDVRQMDFADSDFDAALFIYGQLAVFKREEAQQLLHQVARSLRPGGRLVVELLNQDRVDKKDSTWWYTDNTGLWGDAPFLHLGERQWHADEQISYERFHILHLETGQLDEVHLCDQTYAVDDMTAMMREAGFTSVDVYPAWDGLALYDAEEWVVYVAQR
ncbi:MAG: class I SAM-dependent methyltransferase [Ardenticatenaceae bacterium]|nr:class I SAM-dependent methyltransferase [Ardenticatenaceae bacterium]MCB9445325.1 class I SAM-dependent methyltransferase [Ardenticatenaceae bacterium]